MTNQNIPQPTTPESSKPGAIEESFDFAGLIIDYIINWKWFVVSLVLCLGFTFYRIHTIVPTYRVGAAVYLNDDNTTKTSAVSMSNESPMFDMKNMIDETEIEILKSRNSLLKVVDTLQLSYSYSRDGKWRKIPMYKDNPVTVRMKNEDLEKLQSSVKLNIEKLGEKGVKVHIKYGKKYSVNAELPTLPGTIETPAGDIYLTPNGELFDYMNYTQYATIVRPTWAAAQVSSRLSVHYAENASTIVNFEYVTPLTDLGSDILKMIIHFYNEQIIEDKNRSAIQTEEFILARLRDIQNELDGVEENMRNYREQHQIVDQSMQNSINFAQQRTSESNLTELMRNERLVSDVLTQVRSLDLSPEQTKIQMLSATLLPNEGLTSGIEAFNKEVRLYNSYRESLPADNEMVLRTIGDLRDQRANIVSSLELTKRVLGEQIASLTEVENRSQSALAQQPSVDKGFQEIFRDRSVKEQIYIFLLQKREEIALQKTLATPTAQFIDNPSVMAQVAPQSSRMYMMGLFLAIVVPALLIFARRRLFPKFKEKEDVERITSVPVVGEICVAEKGNSEIVIGDSVSTSAAELFRLLRNNINFIRKEGEKKVIMLTSAISGEGKTFVAMNLAMTYALANKRVCVIGFDIRRPVLAHKLGLSNRVGVTSYLSDQVDDLSEIIFQTDVHPNLYAIPAGPIPPNPNELLLSERMAELFNQLRQEFDYVIIDTAPIGMVSDSFLILPYSDIQLFVSRATYSTRKGIHTLHDSINRGMFDKVYIVLNGVNMKSRTYQYRRYGSYYGSKHNSYGYSSDAARREHNRKKKENPSLKERLKKLFGR